MVLTKLFVLVMAIVFLFSEGGWGEIAAEYGGREELQKKCKCFPDEDCWPSKKEWDYLNETVHGRLSIPLSPIQSCLHNVTREMDPDSCMEALDHFGKDPFFVQTFSGGTQSTGQAGAWTAVPSEYVVEAFEESDIIAAINFANQFNLRLVVKGTGHDYYGRSNAANSLLIWTYKMRNMEFHDIFTPHGCEYSNSSSNATLGGPAVTLGAGLTWMDVYAEATERNLYVQGGGCTSVGVVGFSIGGGYGSWSKMYGTAATNLLEATVITAEGQVVVASKCSHPDLFYALRGGGYGFGVVASMTFRTYPLPELFISTGESYIEANSYDAFEDLLAAFLDLYRTTLIGPKWGDQVRVEKSSGGVWKMGIKMTATNITIEEAHNAWAPLMDWLHQRNDNYTWKFGIKATPGKQYFTLENPDAHKSEYDPREPDRAFFWTGEHREVSEYWLFALNSRYLRVDQFLDDPLVGARKLMNFFQELPPLPPSIPIAIHFNKAQYGANEWAVKELENMPLPPSVKQSFGLILVSFGVEHYSPLVPDEFQYNTSDIIDIQTLCNTSILEECQSSKQFVEAINNFRNATPEAASYFNQADYFEPRFQENFWGEENYAKLLDTKMKWDNNGLFYCHNCVGSEEWEEGGMCRG